MILDFTLYETLKLNQRDEFKVTSQHHITNDEIEIFKLINNSILKPELIAVRIETHNETCDFKSLKVENDSATVKLNLKVHCGCSKRIFDYRNHIHGLLYDYYKSSLNFYAIQLNIVTDFNLIFNIYYKY